MKIANVICLAMTAIGTTLAITTVCNAQADTTAKQKGWYTNAQANRGHQLFNNYCAECHMPDLTGAAGPALKGPQFLATWQTQTLGDLLAFEHQNMPANNPGAVADSQLADITAYILSKNGFPAGKMPLSKGKGNARLLKP
ncbi:MAG TPA: cytochrome c [Burkholderiales bacterium]|nr:cytochrome c [Burkholderiales bacterium]